MKTCLGFTDHSHSASSATTVIPCSGPGRSGWRRLLAASAALALAVAGSMAMAAEVDVPNGDFSDPGNDGSIGGLIGSYLDLPIGSGPWHGTSVGILGLLIGPTVSVDADAQVGRISGVLGANVAGLLNSYGWLSQALSESWQGGDLYILNADINVGRPLSLGLLGDSNVGLAFTSGATVIASTTTADPRLLALDLLAADTYRLRLGHIAGAGVSGPIGIRLFNQPEGLLTADLLPNATFSNVSVEWRDIGPVATITPINTGDQLQPGVGEPVGEPIIALIQDGDGNGIPGVAVTISSPLTGASADLEAPTSDDPPGRVITAVSDLDGYVTFYATANEIGGCYRVIVQPVDESLGIEPAVFHFRNVSDDPGQDSVYCNGFQ